MDGIRIGQLPSKSTCSVKALKTAREGFLVRAEASINGESPEMTIGAHLDVAIDLALDRTRTIILKRLTAGRYDEPYLFLY